MIFKKLLFLFSFSAAFVSVGTAPGCPPGTIPSPHDSETCYKFVNTSATFTEADHNCHSFGGRLGEVDDAYTSTFLALTAYANFSHDSFFWIGGELKTVQTYSIWAWTGFDVNKYLDWFDWSQPDAGTNSDGKCVAVSASEATWTPQNCSVKLPYVCQIPSTNVVTKCESEWTYFELTNQWYKVFAQRNVTQPTAENNCVSVGGHLVSIHSDDENNLVGQMTSTLYVGQWPQVGVWIGLQMDGQGKYSWTDGTETNYFNWGILDPSHNSSACVLFYPDGVVGSESYVRQWDDIFCAHQVNRYVCQKQFHSCHA